ncbi:Retrovirus-related Pol polyprotein from transposon 17.6 [Labeo rohita]|uniref:Gypsy retrotransposon integrase-like protein 1 n=1 Tax=Labeo rohita TaxID=84645 RepID=A0ABQ8MQY4_LABRO|nr:Retrovirus-related Pol polyprotein from transposon 17.6 [Labeo rohita]
MEFDLLAFTLSPTTEVFHKCRKKDLLLIAEFFNIEVPREEKKQVIKDFLFNQLVLSGILPEVEEQPAVTSKAVTEEVASGVNATETLRSEELSKKPIPPPRSRPLSTSVSSPASTPTTPVTSRVEKDAQEFDVSKYIKLVSPFRESEVDAYFVAFERIAGKLKWPRDMWALLLQCSFTGKAQEICASLPIEQSLDYEVVKTAVLRAYELVPEAYRQKFRAHAKSVRQTHMEFAREKRALFEKWCLSSKITTFEQLQKLILLEDFKSCLSEGVVVHLNEQKVTALLDAAVLAEFVLTHRNVFTSVRLSNIPLASKNTLRDFSRFPQHMSKSNGNRDGKSAPSGGRDRRSCFYCLDQGHLIAECQAWKKKNAEAKTKKAALVQTMSLVEDESMQPFLLSGSVSLSDTEHQPIVILRDTGSAQSFILKELLPFSQSSYTGTDVLIRGIAMGCDSVPLHQVHLKSDLVNGLVHLGVREQLPFDGVGLILGNDLAGGRVFPRPIVVNNGKINDTSSLSQEFPSTFPVCAVTRAQSKKFEDVVNLTESFLQVPSEPLKCELTIRPALGEETDINNPHETLGVDRDQLIAAQKIDPSLTPCFDAALDCNQVPDVRIPYYCDNGVLMRKWKPENDDSDCREVHQIVLPAAYRPQMLKLAHENVLAGHLGVNKTFHRVTKYFFWPGCKSSITKFCRTCDVCQRSGKPNQKVPVAPLHPVPVMAEPFERLILDCVGPLPKTKSGYQYVLTIMCTATRFPEAIPLRTVKSPVVIKALVMFCTTFGLPKEIQTDQGSNFTSKIFTQTLAALGVSHRMSSAHHPESQGSLERYHQTLKATIRAYCIETGREWDEGLPFLLFATRESVQESIGFSPADLVFGNTVRGPLKMLSEQLLSVNRSFIPVSEYVTSFRERLHGAWDMAQKHLSATQVKMKSRFDKKSVDQKKLKNSVILRDLYNTLSYLTDCQRKELLQLIDKYPSLFADMPGRTSVLTHDIDVGDSLPIKQNAYGVNPKKRAIMKEEIEYMLCHDIAIPSQSPWKDCVDRVGSTNFVSKLDLLKGYWQVPLTPRASEISAFVTPDHFMQYKVLAFGMRNASATFQRLMQRVLVGVTNCEVYTDDVVVYSSSWEEHVKALEDVFSKLAAASLTLNAAKCEFEKAVVTYLGKQVGQGCVRPVVAKVEAILQFPTPSNKRELRRFLDMAGYYRGFCRNFSAVVSPLTDHLSSSLNAPVLSAPNFEKPFKLQVDASATGAGAVLLQEDEHDVDHPISYFSKKFTFYQRRYSSIEKEALALLLALQHFDVYVGGRITITCGSLGERA